MYRAMVSDRLRSCNKTPVPHGEVSRNLVTNMLMRQKSIMNGAMTAMVIAVGTMGGRERPQRSHGASNDLSNWRQREEDLGEGWEERRGPRDSRSYTSTAGHSNGYNRRPHNGNTHLLIDYLKG